MDSIVNVVGVVRGTSKGGSPYTVLHILTEFDEYMTSKGACGQKAENVYILGHVVAEVGSKCQLVYGVGYGGKAIVKDVLVVE